LGPYTIEAELGSGGMGTVYRAQGPDGVVALKVLHPHLLASAEARERFRREAEIGRRVVHANVVRALDLGSVVVHGVTHHYLVMEHVEGQTLRALLAELGRVPEELCRHVGRAVARGLAAIHAAGVAHRDLKPANVLITADHVVKVMDLGVARLLDEAIRLTQTGAFLGSVMYAAPEQLRGVPSGPAADFYSLGLVLFELATGRHPFAAVSVFRGGLQGASRDRPGKTPLLPARGRGLDLVARPCARDPAGYATAAAADPRPARDRGLRP
jgi:serine/threonine-protein kinase